MNKYKIDNLDIARFIFTPLESNMFVILGKKEALIIDPNVSEDAKNLLNSLGIKKTCTLLTHEHPDHTSGVNYIAENFDNTLVCNNACAKSIADKRNNRPVLISFVLSEKDKTNGTDNAQKFNNFAKSYEYHADITFEDKFLYEWETHCLKFVSTPGHSPGSCCIFLDKIIVFTGDSLLLDYPVITRFPGGSLDAYNNITMPFLKSLDKNLNVFPGHGNMFKMSDFYNEKRTIE
jgi:hydroxyacylglutathione hydrolase